MVLIEPFSDYWFYPWNKAVQPGQQKTVSSSLYGIYLPGRALVKPYNRAGISIPGLSDSMDMHNVVSETIGKISFVM